MNTLVFRKNPVSNCVYLRDSIIATYFFPRPIHESIEGVRRSFDLYRQTIPADALTWSAIGANCEEWSTTTAKTIASCHRLLQPEAAMKRSMTACELTDGIQGADAPGFHFDLVGSPLKSEDNRFPEKMCLLQLGWPMESLTESTVEAMVALNKEIAGSIPFVSGYVSPGLQWSPLESGPGIDEARGIAARHPGYDLEDNAGCRIRIGKRVRGARWLTFLGPELVNTLGGEATIRQKLSRQIQVSSLPNGLLIRAGTLPELGDTNRAEGTPLLREVAQLLEPITYFEELTLLGQVFRRDRDAHRRWERRFLE